MIFKRNEYVVHVEYEYKNNHFERKVTIEIALLIALD
jgi:hypothetical protein